VEKLAMMRRRADMSGSRIPIPNPAMVVALLALLIACSGAAVASIPSTDGTITACRDNKSGALRVIDTQRSQSCKASEAQLTWKNGIVGQVADSLHADNATNADTVDGKHASDFYAAGSRVADSAHADEADSAVSAGDDNTLDGKDSAQFAGSSHTHSGADITSGTVDADRVEDGSGSALDADTIDGLNSPALQRRVGASCDPGSAIRAIGDDGTVTCEADDSSGAQEAGPLPAVKARSSNLVVNDNTHTPLELTFEDFDQVGPGETFGITEMHGNATSAFRAPRAGIYEIQAEVIWDGSSYGSSGTGERRVILRKNFLGCGDGSFDDMDVQYADPGKPITNRVSTLLTMTTGESVRICGYQNSGEALNVMFVFASMHYVSAQ
jgi:hypothetical protein